MPPDSENALHWTAFRYVAGELAADEAASFEDLLARDQSAREAVAEAVALVSCALAARPARPVRRGVPGRWIAVGMLAATAASMLLAAGLHFGILHRGAPEVATRDAVPAGPDDPAHAVALTWSGLRQEGEADGHAEPSPWLDEPPAHDEADEHALPAWLLDAVALGDAAKPDGPARREN